MIPFTQSLCSPLTTEWLRDCGFDSQADAYAICLTDRGYRPSTISQYLNSVAHFAHWCQSQAIDTPQVDEQTIKWFIRRHLPHCRCATHCSRHRHIVKAALKHLVGGPSYSGRALPRTQALSSAVNDELRGFEHHLKEVRGHSDWTRHIYLSNVRRFLSEQFHGKPIVIGSLLPRDVVRVMQKLTVGWKPASIKAFNCSLRSYFSFKTMGGEQAARLCKALPKVALWRHAQLPKMVSQEDVRRLLGSYDRTKATGKRDYAIARCLIDLGLRRSEVARLKLEDIDWREGVMRLSAKGQRIDLLPLPAATGGAIADYLRNGRPQTTFREIFVRHNAPCNVPADVDLVRGAIRQAAIRCGLQDRIRGTHILRHTLAGRLVQSGTSLKEIADLLRHRDIDTTTIYAKVDFAALTDVAQPWPGSQA
jgi:site-specific recombinase XerD